MFGKSKDDNDRLPATTQQPQRPAATKPAGQGSADQVSTISRGMTVVGKISGEGTLNVFGQVEGELHALNILINASRATWLPRICSSVDRSRVRSMLAGSS
jgi:hypothetical protein